MMRLLPLGCRTSWAKHEEIADHTAKGWALHAMVLDIDVGPMLQTHKLLDLGASSRAPRAMRRPLSAAELEMMNLTGDGTGLDMVTMPQAMRERVPTANFFQQQGFERNPVARRTGVVAALIAEIEGKMASASRSQGARELAAAF